MILYIVQPWRNSEFTSLYVKLYSLIYIVSSQLMLQSVNILIHQNNKVDIQTKFRCSLSKYFDALYSRSFI